MLIIQIFLISSLFSVTWEIRQDGTGDFTSISAAITAAENGDILLVYPGIYYERLNYQGKNITITSLYNEEQPDNNYIINTVIDGNHEGSVVVFNSGETRNAVLNGFTIRHGEGEFHYSSYESYGGGIYISASSPVISNCHIKYNRSYIGSAIRLYQSGNPLLRGNTISHNHSVTYGAVVASGGPNNLEFCNEVLNNIYLNYGGRNSDLFFGGHDQSSVVIDTFTVANPDRSFFATSRNVPDDFILTINHGKIEPVPADLFVAPFGSDSNSGLTPEDPLQTIAMAMIKIAPDSLQQRTVHVADGIYSRSLNNQRFPIQLRSYINITGNNKATTILDMEGETVAFHHYTLVTSGVIVDNVGMFNVSNFTILHGGNPSFRYIPGSIDIYYTNLPISFENIDMIDGHSQGLRGQIIIYHSGDLTLKNIFISDSIGGEAMRICNDWGNTLRIYGENIRVRNQVPGPFHPHYINGYGGGIILRTGDVVAESFEVTLVNLEVTDCIIDNVDPPWQGTPWGNFSCSGPFGDVQIINATFGNNTTSTPYGGGVGLSGSINYKLINSIIYGNTPDELHLYNTYPQDSNIYISHSLINNGENGILYFQNPNTIVQWGEGNIDADPMWLGDVDPDYTGNYPYKLHPDSPAIDAGTLDIPGFEFPEYDLAGNPRIYGNSIDMGAYEWNPLSVEPQEEAISNPSIHDYRLHNYPNPVVNMRGMGRGKGVGTNISFMMPEAGRVVIDIYNLKGQFVRRVFNAFVTEGQYDVLWDGRDEQEKIVSTGFYMYQMQINGSTVATGRCTFIK